MHIAMHVKSTKMLPTHNVIYSIVQWYLKERHDLSEVPFGPSVIIRLFHRRFYHGPMVVNNRRVPLDMTDSKKKIKLNKCLLKCDIYKTVLHIVFELYLEKLYSYELYSH